MKKRVITEKHLHEYESYLIRAEKSHATVEKYMHDARDFAAAQQGRDITKEAVLAWKQMLLDRGCAVRTVNAKIAAVNGLLTFLNAPELRVKPIRLQKQIYCREERQLQKQEYLRLLDAARRSPALYLIMETICGTGIRVSELQHFTVETVHTGEISVSCKGKTRVILIPGKLKRKLLRYAEKQRIRTGAIFRTGKGTPLHRSTIWRQMKQLCTAAKVSAGKVFPHNLRKLFARTFHAMEKDVAKLADLLGHSSIDTTRIYIMSTGQEHRQVLERMGLII